MSIFIVHMENLSPSNLLKSPSFSIKNDGDKFKMKEISMRNFSINITNPAKLADT